MKCSFAGVMRFIHDERGATAVEYALLVALISVAIITAVRTLGQNMNAIFNNIATQLGS